MDHVVQQRPRTAALSPPGHCRSAPDGPSDRPRGLSLEFLHFASLRGGGIPLCGMPSIIAGGEGRRSSGPNPRTKAKRAMRRDSGARRIWLAQIRTCWRRATRGVVRPALRDAAFSDEFHTLFVAVLSVEGVGVGCSPRDSPRACRGAERTLTPVPGGCGPEEQRPSPPAMILGAAPRRPGAPGDRRGGLSPHVNQPVRARSAPAFCPWFQAPDAG